MFIFKFFNEARRFGGRLCFRLQASKASNLVDTLDTAILSPPPPQKKNIVQGDQKVSVHLMITILKVTSNVQSDPRQSPEIY
jgi:hypothetical protein